MCVCVGGGGGGGGVRTVHTGNSDNKTELKTYHYNFQGGQQVFKGAN